MKIHTQTTLILCVTLAKVWCANVSANVVINEIHYHPVEEPAFKNNGDPVMPLWHDQHEFVEIHNNDAAPINLGGWKFNRGIRFVFPDDAKIDPGGYLVICRYPEKVRAVPAYNLESDDVLGPWSGSLDNDGETLELANASGTLIDRVRYAPHFPWPGTADALGVSERWTGIDPLDHQYRGRSLERISASHPSHDPANWIASPADGDPTPGNANSQQNETVHPVAVLAGHKSAQTGSRNIIPLHDIEFECAFSSNTVASVTLIYFLDDIEDENEDTHEIKMEAVQEGDRRFFRAILPAQPRGSLVRYRFLAQSNGTTITSPRQDDPFKWNAFAVVSPALFQNSHYHLLISKANLTTLERNLRHNPLVIGGALANYGASRSEGWNATVPAVFTWKSEVWDVHVRFQGSPYFRGEPGDKHIGRFKIRFPDYRKFEGQSAILITDKGPESVAGHSIVRAGGLPISDAKFVRFKINEEDTIERLQLGEMNEGILKQFQIDRARLHGFSEPGETGRLIKSSGLFRDSGPWGIGDGFSLWRNGRYSAVSRYPWTYPSKNKDWLGYNEFISMLVSHEEAGGPLFPNIPYNEQLLNRVRNNLESQWNVSATLDYLAITNWMGFWDDWVHNYFYWQNSDGKWTLVPWDFDHTMIHPKPEEGSFGLDFIGNVFESSFLTTHFDQYLNRLRDLTHNLLHPENLTYLNLDESTMNFARDQLPVVLDYLGETEYERPVQPTPKTPANGDTVLASEPLVASDYAFDGSIFAFSPHAGTLWEIRHAQSDYDSPVYRYHSNIDLTSIKVPPEVLRSGETYYWRCTYFSQSGRASLISREAHFTVGQPLVPTSVVRINEFACDNESATPHDNRFPDWVELHNTGTEEFDLEGHTLTDDSHEPAAFQFPGGSRIPAGGYLVVWCGEPDENTTGLYSGFKLDRHGEQLALYSPEENGERRLLDHIEFGLQPTDYAMARTEDHWVLATPTPGRENNGLAKLGEAEKVRISEWMAAPESGDDWFELVNTADQPVDISGWIVADASETSTPLPNHSYLGPGGHLKMLADGDWAAGANHVDFSLNAYADRLTLRNSTGVEIDGVRWWNQQSNVSEGRRDLNATAFYRFPDGGSPGKPNSPTGSPFVDGDNDGMDDQWELLMGLDTGLNDRLSDNDGDGFSNIAEFAANTDPLDARSFARLDWKGANLRFVVAPDRVYELEAANQLTGPWKVLKTYAPASRSREETLSVLEETKRSYFRLRMRLP